jgi:pimeloyl-ACP methyl ester carboxylesterase
MIGPANRQRRGRLDDASRGFTPARITALALIAVLAVGLAYLRFAPGPEPLSVPVGARAGDLILRSGSYATENGSYDADVGTLIVPENRADPQSRLIALPVTRIRARSEHPREPIFYLNGGPGMTNMAFKQASRFAADRDVVLVGYRGVDGSVRLDCPEVESALKHATDFPAEESLRAYGDAYRACVERLTDEGVDLAGYGLPQQVDDLESARVALGYGRINLLSESAGTRTALLYAWRYPERLHRSVMVGVNPPGHFLYDAQTTDEQLGRYAALCAADAGCSARTDDLAASLRRTAAAMPERWLLLPIKGGLVRALSFTGLMGATSAVAPPGVAVTLDGWLSAAEGDASGFWLTSVLGDLTYPKLFVWGQYAAAARLDAQAARAYFSTGGQESNSNLGRAATAFAWGGGRLADAWPAVVDEGEYRRVRPSEVETLLIGGALDVSTPPQVATKELLPYLPNGKEVVLPGFGHTSSFWSEQPAAGTRLITTYFASGRVDDSLYRPQQIDFTPTMTLTAMAKMVAGTMLGLALLTVGSLLWLARRVHRRGRFGHTASTALRSLAPLPLGLGGWCLGALIAMALLPGVPLDDQVLVVVSASVPIGLGIYLAWVHRDWSAKTRTTGFAAAAGGALIGAWLGFQATEGLLAPITAIVGAAVGANLTLLALDMWRDRPVRGVFGATNTKAMLGALTAPAASCKSAVRRLGYHRP